MGFRVSWFAVRGKDREAILADAGLRGTGAFEEFPEAPFTGVSLPGGWCGVMSRSINDHHMSDAFLTRLSAGCEVLSAHVNETTMDSSAAGWRDGRQVWSVFHNAQQDLHHLEVAGDVPPVFAAIEARLRREQENDTEVDYVFDIPVELARELTGYRYDRDPESDLEEPFEILEPVTQAPPKRGLFGFGRR
jgi:hypothetical protein